MAEFSLSEQEACALFVKLKKEETSLPLTEANLLKNLEKFLYSTLSVEQMSKLTSL